MNITNSPFSPLAVSGVHILPSTPGNEKSITGRSNSHTGVSSDTTILHLSKLQALACLYLHPLKNHAAYPISEKIMPTPKHHTAILNLEIIEIATINC
jgi:hypothetical protein